MQVYPQTHKHKDYSTHKGPYVKTYKHVNASSNERIQGCVQTLQRENA
jgi:hypothetical protein